MKTYNIMQTENTAPPAVPADMLQKLGSLCRIIADTHPAELTDDVLKEATKDTSAPLYCFNASKMLRDAGYITMNKITALIEADRRDRFNGVISDIEYKIKTSPAAELQKEVLKTLLFFCTTDYKMYGHITPGTAQHFNTQGAKFPDELKQFVKA